MKAHLHRNRYGECCFIDRHEMREEMVELNQSRNRIGKKAAGRLLDGRAWDGFPKGGA